ncbi:MAG: phospho-sugar mutase [Actinomycetota bacterium]
MSIDPRFRAEVEKWIDEDPDLLTKQALQNLLDTNNEMELRSCFSGFLEFGTAGLRGPLGPGPSRMNRAVVTKTAAGIATYMKRHGMTSVVIGRDARYGSEDFTRDTAEIMMGAGFTTYVLPRPLPTPVLAYAVRNLACDVGIMVTASHNPPQDNGYKVYLGGTVDGVRYEGSQIISPTDGEISRDIAAVAPLPTLPRRQGWIVLDESHVDAYVEATSRLATQPGTLKVVYSAMHGVGTETLRKVFTQAGFPEPILVTEQAEPDPDFPTVAFPNPEEPGAIDLSLKKSAEVSADLVIANDPDADRCAAAILDQSGHWRMLRGDEVGALLGEYMARKAPNKEAILANSIVSSSILSKIARHYDLRFMETLTGFKWLAKIPHLWFGYEEALGYAVDSTSVNDKDGISAALVLTQLATDLKSDNRTLGDLLEEIWQRHGYHGTKQISVRTTSVSQIDAILSRFRDNTPTSIGRFAVTQFDDLEKPTDGLPPTNGVRIYLAGDIRVIVRPSGTEPKIKCYIEVVSKDRAESETIISELEKELRTFLS